MADGKKPSGQDTDMDNYQYQPLPSPDTHIRLIELPPGKKSGVITCTMAPHPIAQCPEYEAVSHCWGDPNDKVAIQILDDSDDTTGNGAATMLRIPSSLNAFLLRTRARGTKRTLWADAICINQADAEEKGQQVRLMRDIYRRARRTLVWLGGEAHDSARGIAFAKRIFATAQGKSADARWARALDRVPGYRTFSAIYGRDWRALFALFERPWFARAWIVQEVAVSPTLWVVCGDAAVIAWGQLVGALWHLLQHETWILEFFEQNRMSSIWLLLSQHECAQGLRRTHYGVLARHRQACASDPRDHVYSFYGLSCHQSFVEHAIEPRYDLPVEKVYTNLALATLAKVSNLDCLCIPRPSKRPDSLDLPSWVPDWSRSDPICCTLLDLEVGDPKQASRYDATRGSTYTPKIDKERLTLELSGYIVDSVAAVSSTWISQESTGRRALRGQAAVLRGNQRLVHDWETTLGIWTRAAPYPTGEDFRDVAWQTFVAGNLANGKDAGRAEWHGFQARQRYLRWPPRLGLQDALWAYVVAVLVGHMLHLFGVRNPEIPFRARTGGMLGRRAMRTGKGYVGQAPGIAEVGDQIALFEGGKLPFVIRRRGEAWELVGECYVNGIMSGEAWGEKCEPFVIS